MMKKFFSILLFSFLVLSNTTSAFAVEDPLVVQNNRFGIHILEENDLIDAAALVNSEGGDWGYATLVIRSDQRDLKHWQKIFNKMRRLHLIPIIRIATKQQNSHWKKPNFDEIDGWVSFLKELNWVVKNRYIVVGNEPNHAKEWGGKVNPFEYAEYLYSFSKRLKETSPDFFVLPAGFDSWAPTDSEHMRESEFLVSMLNIKPNVFDFVDGWASHSYPNPDFSGSPNSSGRGSVRSFDWELKYLKKLGIDKSLLVFVTETGWAHNIEEAPNGYKSASFVSQSLKNAFENAWDDPRIVAVTPFILNYQQPPFDVFSWKKEDGSFYAFYYEIQKVKKQSGQPVQEVSGEITYLLVPPVLKLNGSKYGLAVAKNTGQSIWYKGEHVGIDFHERNLKIHFPLYFDIEPGSSGLVFVQRI